MRPTLRKFFYSGRSLIFHSISLSVQNIEVSLWLNNVLGILIALFFTIAGFNTSIGSDSCAFIGAPLIFLLTVIYSRVLLEMAFVIFRISDQLAEIDTASAEEKPEPRESIQWNI